MSTPHTVFASIRDLLRYAVSEFNRHQVFFGHGSTNALDEAAYLILHTLKLPLDKIEPFFDARLLPHEVDEVLRVIERRTIERVPASYITNEAWLGTYRFYVDERVIVPRSFIAELIPEFFSPWVQDPNEITDILELCTGSGCLAIMMADAFPQATVDAVDISKDALAVATKNVNDYELGEQVTLFESDLYNALPEKQYDLIITNPPYVNSESMSRLPAEYRCEPEIALGGGDDGMDLVRKIVSGAASRLKPNGFLMVEIGNERAYAEAAFVDLNLTWVTTSAGDDMIFLLSAADLKAAFPSN